jgi:hypothetical protein
MQEIIDYPTFHLWNKKSVNPTIMYHSTFEKNKSYEVSQPAKFQHTKSPLENSEDRTSLNQHT